MAINWNTVRADHVVQAFDLVSADAKTRHQRVTGIFVRSGDDLLPAKQVIRIAYLVANNLPLDTKLKFTSGEGTVNRLRDLGFHVERRGQITSSEAPTTYSESGENG